MAERRLAGAQGMKETKCNPNCDCEERSLHQIKELMTDPKFHGVVIMIGENRNIWPKNLPYSSITLQKR